MRIDLYVVRRTRILAISKPAEWVSLAQLVTTYNQQYSLRLVSKLLKKLAMHEKRMLRTLEKMTEDGYYEWSSEIGTEGRLFRFVTKTPNAPKKR